MFYCGIDGLKLSFLVKEESPELVEGPGGRGISGQTFIELVSDYHRQAQVEQGGTPTSRYALRASHKIGGMRSPLTTGS